MLITEWWGRNPQVSSDHIQVVKLSISGSIYFLIENYRPFDQTRVVKTPPKVIICEINNFKSSFNLITAYTFFANLTWKLSGKEVLLFDRRNWISIQKKLTWEDSFVLPTLSKLSLIFQLQ